MKYWAFISYSHRDSAWARRLLTTLETYRVPPKLVGAETRDGPRPSRLMPIFLDRDELPSAPDLSDKVREALQASRYLIVICSPSAANSRWVDEEVRRFKALGREDRVLCLIVRGEPTAEAGPGLRGCFPPSTRRRIGPDGLATGEPVEPLAADARRRGDGRFNAGLKLIAGLLGVSFDDLRQRELARQRRRELRRALGGAALALAAVLGYLLLADAGIAVPGGRAIRDRLDRMEASVARRVRGEDEVRRAASDRRAEILAMLERGRAPGGWVQMSLDPRMTPEQRAADRVDVWSSSQAIWAALKAPGAERDRLRAFLDGLRAPFAPGVAVEAGGVKYGWAPHPRYPYTEAEPAIETVSALAAALARPGLLGPGEREEFAARLAYAQEVLRPCRPTEDGGWNMFPNQTDASWHDPYTTTIALLALLEVRAAGQPWEGSVARRDALLAATARWLIERFDAESDPPGWRGVGEDANEVFDGMTLQIYAELLRAGEEAGVALPPRILAEIPRHLARCAGRGLDFPVASGENTAEMVDHRGRAHMATEAVRYLWYPWAIDAAVRWLRRPGEAGAPPEQRVAVRRALGHLVVDLGPDAVRQARENWTFISSEMLAGFSAIPPPDAGPARPQEVSP